MDVIDDGSELLVPSYGNVTEFNVDSGRFNTGKALNTVIDMVGLTIIFILKIQFMDLVQYFALSWNHGMMKNIQYNQRIWFHYNAILLKIVI